MKLNVGSVSFAVAVFGGARSVLAVAIYGEWFFLATWARLRCADDGAFELSGQCGGSGYTGLSNSPSMCPSVSDPEGRCS